ncbi:MAG: hypothetical protein IID39_07005 [Planctomycetes bacterium]|nr:hypothetical protein [Planctomycetota bacterium]
MSEVPQGEPNPSKPGEQAGGDMLSDVDLDRLLDKAAEQAETLNQEVGDPQTPSEKNADLDPLTSDRDVGDVEEELERVEHLLADVAEGPSETLTLDESQEAPAADPSDVERTSADSGRGDGVQEECIASPEATAEDSEKQTDPSDDRERGEIPGEPSAVEVAETLAVSAAASGASKSSRLSRIRDRAVAFREKAYRFSSKAIERAAEVLLRIVDTIDRLFAWISYDTRRTLGWAAAAISVAAVSILAHSIW